MAPDAEPDFLVHVGVQDTKPERLYAAASGVVFVLGMYHGAVPLVVRFAFDGDQRFAPALWLPSPWWWITCIAIVLVALALHAVIDSAKQRRFPSEPDGLRSSPGTEQRKTTSSYDAASGVVFLVGIYNGVAPFVSRLHLRGELLLALPLLLRAPWWWITSIAVIVATIVLLAVIDDAKQRRFPEDR